MIELGFGYRGWDLSAWGFSFPFLGCILDGLPRSFAALDKLREIAHREVNIVENGSLDCCVADDRKVPKMKWLG